MYKSILYIYYTVGIYDVIDIMVLVLYPTLKGEVLFKIKQYMRRYYNGDYMFGSEGFRS